VKVLVSASEPGLDAPVDPRFGRAPYYVIVDPDTMEYETIENPNAQAPHGAGMGAANFAKEQGVQAVITGRVGPNAEAVLREAGIEIVLVPEGTVREAVEYFKSGAPAGETMPPPGPGPAGPPSPGGYGMWWPGWRGWGGWGRGWGWGPPPPPYPYPDPQAELEALRTYRDMLKRQLEEIEARIKELERNR